MSTDSNKNPTGILTLSRFIQNYKKQLWLLIDFKAEVPKKPIRFFFIFSLILGLKSLWLAAVAKHPHTFPAALRDHWGVPFLQNVFLHWIIMQTGWHCRPQMYCTNCIAEGTKDCSYEKNLQSFLSCENTCTKWAETDVVGLFSLQAECCSLCGVEWIRRWCFPGLLCSVWRVAFDLERKSLITLAFALSAQNEWTCSFTGQKAQLIFHIYTP